MSDKSKRFAVGPSVSPRPKLRPRQFKLSEWLLVAVACAGGLVAILLVWLKPAPPVVVTMASGPPGGAYHVIALKYAEALDKLGIRLRLVQTEGASDNLRLISGPRSTVDVAIVQGGLSSTADIAGLSSVGLIFYEPFWIFHRLPKAIETIAELKGRRIAIGSRSSGTNHLARALLELNGVGPGESTLVETDFELSAQELSAGSIDAMVIVASTSSPIVQRLLRDRATKLFSFERARGYAKHFGHLHPLTLHKGAVDIRRNLPPEDVELVATAASLVVRSSLHPAIVYLLAQIAADLHRKPSLLESAGEFPKTIDPELPTAEAAERFFRHGAPLLHRHLPFWIADFLERALILLAPLAAIAIPVTKLAMVGLRWSINRRVLGWYVRLQNIEDQLALTSDEAERARLSRELDELEAEVISYPAIPLDQSERAYEVRQHIAFVRDRLGARRAQIAP